MSTLCSCDVSLQNTGSPSCSPVFGVTKQFILVPLIANDGTANKIDPSSPLNLAWITALINEADDSKRFYPTGALKNVAGERADPLYETFDDQSKEFIRPGIRNVTALILKKGPELLALLNSNRCSEFGIYIIDANGSVFGKIANNDGFLYPIQIEASTFYAKLVFTNDSAVQKLMLSFEWENNQRDEDLRMILASSITGVNLANVKGLMNVYTTILYTSTTEMVLGIYAKFGNIITNYPVQGLVAADFISSDSGTSSKIYNETDASDVTLTSVSESNTYPGQYTLNYTAQTVADVLQPLVKKNGLDATTMLGTTGTVA
jgi:hypothetical protein